MVISIIIGIILCIIAVVIYLEYRNEKRYQEERRRQQERKEKKISPKVTKRPAGISTPKPEETPADKSVSPKPDNLQKPVAPAPSQKPQKPVTKTKTSTIPPIPPKSKEQEPPAKKETRQLKPESIEKQPSQAKKTTQKPTATPTAKKVEPTQKPVERKKESQTKKPDSATVKTPKKTAKPTTETITEKNLQSKAKKPTETPKEVGEKTQKATQKPSVELPKGNYPDFNYERLLEMGLSEEEAHEFIQDLIPQIGDKIPLLDEALKIPNFHEMERLTHSIKGSSTTIGTGGVSDLLVEYNTYLKTGDEVPVAEAYQAHLKHYYEKLKKQFPQKD